MLNHRPREIAHRSARGLVWACLCLASLSQAAETRQRVESVRPLLQAAVLNGSAKGVLVGPVARAMAQQFGSTAPIEVDVKVIGPHPRQGCKRLDVVTRQDRVVQRERLSRDQPLGAVQPPQLMQASFQVSACADGSMAPNTRPPAGSASGVEGVKP